jgi:hypothetical protein
MDFKNYCNCYSWPYGAIQVECYDTVIEAIYKHEDRKDDDHRCDKIYKIYK